MRFFLGGFWATEEPWSAKSDQFWVDIFKPKWNLSYIDGARLRDSEPDACVSPLYRQTAKTADTGKLDEKPVDVEIAHNYKRGHVSVFSTIKNVGFRLNN